MRIGVLTSLYPGPTRPYEGIFAERRWTLMQARGHRIAVVHPLPLTPPAIAGPRARWRAIAGLPEREERGGIPIRRPRYLHLPRLALGNARRFARAGLGELGEPELVVCDYAWPAAYAARELAHRRIPCVISGRGSDVLQVREQPRLAQELAGCLRAAGHWCAVSADLVRAMDALGGKPGQGVLVPNGVDCELFQPRERGPARRALGLPEERPLVLVVGHLIPRKDPMLALAAFERGAPSEALLVFLGRGELEEELARRAGARVRLVGERPPEELATWYAAADLLLLTSRREGRPNVVLEALASGRPVLATDAGGTAEILAGEPRMLAATRDPGELGRRLAELLVTPPAPERCRALVSALSWERALDALERCLEAARRACA
jgi:glycosyltransferase involved in cell wall biosynthesis